QIFNLILNRIYIIVAIPLVAVVATIIVVYNFVEPTYTASTTIYVINKTDGDISSSDLNAGLALTNDYQEIAMSNTVLDAVAQEFGYESKGYLMRNYDISVSAKTDTRIMKISVSGRNKTLVDDVANSIGHNFKIRAVTIMDLDNVEVVDTAKEPVNPSAPNKMGSVLISAVAGLVLALAIVLLIEALNTTIRTPEDVEKVLGLPVLAKIPKMEEVE
ncbi:MAG: hypothetical protein IJO48_06990, partial [Clostridia bacterium]|nr:hypothetical protein [Clostridia bacterium]